VGVREGGREVVGVVRACLCACVCTCVRVRACALSTNT
jgi:hypothetical protein